MNESFPYNIEDPELKENSSSHENSTYDYQPFEKTMEKSKRLYNFFNKIDDIHCMHDIKTMMKYEDTTEFLQLLMEEKDSDWKKYWNRLKEWENADFEYWKNSKEGISWLFYIAFGDL